MINKTVIELLIWQWAMDRPLPDYPEWIAYWESQGYIMDLETGQYFKDADHE